MIFKVLFVTFFMCILLFGEASGVLSPLGVLNSAIQLGSAVQKQLGFWLSPKKDSGGLKCAPGSDDNQVDKLVDHFCDCCGCKSNEMCRQATYTLVTSGLVTPFDANYCKQTWTDLFNKTVGMSKFGKNCPNENYEKKTKEYPCQIGFGCCNGKPEDDINSAIVQACATSQVLDMACETCKSTSAADFLLRFAGYAVNILLGHIL